MTNFDLRTFHELHTIRPDALINALFKNTKDGILYVSDSNSDPFDPEEYVYRCVMSWTGKDCESIVSELSNMTPEEEPDGLFIREVKARSKRLRRLLEMEAPSAIVCNEANLLLTAMVLNRFATEVEKVTL